MASTSPSASARHRLHQHADYRTRQDASPTLATRAAPATHPTGEPLAAGRLRTGYARWARSGLLTQDQRARAMFREELDQHHMRRLAIEDDDALDSVLQ